MLPSAPHGRVGGPYEGGVQNFRLCFLAEFISMSCPMTIPMIISLFLAL